MIAQIELDRRLRERAGHRGIGGVTRAFQYLEHRIGDNWVRAGADRPLTFHGCFGSLLWEHVDRYFIGTIRPLRRRYDSRNTYRRPGGRDVSNKSSAVHIIPLCLRSQPRAPGQARCYGFFLNVTSG
jgi:hypothetical protein